MFEPGSRYFALPSARLMLPDGRQVVYVRRRFLPRPEELQVLAEVTMVQGDRLDLIAARTLGDPEQFWRIGDAHRALDPAELEEVGRVLAVPIPEPEPAGAVGTDPLAPASGEPEEED